MRETPQQPSCTRPLPAVSKNQAEEKAFGIYDEFNKIQKIESDFDRELKILLKDREGK